MHDAILYQLEGEPSTDSLPSRLDNGLPAAKTEATSYLDGRVIHHGTLACRIEVDQRVPVVGNDTIVTETETQTRRIQADYYADLEDRWAGVSTSDGESLLEDYLVGTAGVVPYEIEIDLVGFAERLPTDVTTNGIVYSQSIEDGHNRDAAGAKWHEDASKSGIPTEGVSVLSVNYTWDGGLVQAMLASSGYVAIYRDWTVDRFARWVADEVEPYLRQPTDQVGDLSTEGVA